jgi:hypothetical protein
MTILCCDFKMLAADSLTTAGDSKVYNRSKIRIIKQHAIATAGSEQDGIRFEEWLFAQNGEKFICEDDFSVMVLTKTNIKMGETPDGSTELLKLWDPMYKFAMGVNGADAAAEVLMRVAGYNAHKAAMAAARYHTHCGEPIYSITKKQLENVHPDFDGYWIGTYQTPIAKIDDVLITHKQWLRT